MIESQKKVVLFEEGDVVTLKSGGPEMTVFSVKADDHGIIGREVACVWFDKLGEGHVTSRLVASAATLQLVKAKRK